MTVTLISKFPEAFCKWKFHLEMPHKLNDYGHTRVYPTNNCFNCNGLNQSCEYYIGMNRQTKGGFVERRL